MDAGVVFVPGVPGFPPGASWGAVNKEPPAEAGGKFTRTCGIVPQFAWRASARSHSTRPSGPGAPTKSPRRKPGDSGWHAFPFTMRRGFAPVNRVPSCGMDGGVVFVPGVPGFPPGASWNGGVTASLFKRSSKRFATEFRHRRLRRGWYSRRRCGPHAAARRPRPPGGAAARPSGEPSAFAATAQGCRGHGWAGIRAGASLRACFGLREARPEGEPSQVEAHLGCASDLPRLSGPWMARQP